VLGVEYALDVPLMRLSIRHGGTVESILTNEDSVVLTNESDAILMVE